MATNNRKLAAIIGSAAAAGAVALTASFEGVSTEPYQDRLARDVWTVCYGDTHVEMRPYTLPECQQLLADRLADYAAPVRKLTPGFDTLTPGQKIAIVDLVYNIGVASYEKVPIRDRAGKVIGWRPSTIRTLYSTKQFPLACDAFKEYKYAGDRDCSIAANKCSGIMRRREAERRACLGE